MALWASIVEGDAYFITRMGGADHWPSGSGTDADKTAALTTAQMDLVNCGLFGLTDATTPTTAMKNALCEQALFRLIHDSDRRVGLQVQGVKHAGIVKEDYIIISGIPISIYAKGILDTALGTGSVVVIADLERDVTV